MGRSRLHPGGEGLSLGGLVLATEITTALDSWIPLLIFGALALFAFTRAYFILSFFAVLSLLNQVLPTSFWTTFTDVAFFIVALAGEFFIVALQRSRR